MDRKNLASLRRMARDAETAGRVRLLRSFDPALAGARGLASQLAELLGEPAQPRT